MGTIARGATTTTVLLLLLAAFASPAAAQCSSTAPPSNTTVTCSGNSSTPVVAVAGSTGVTINVVSGASVSASHTTAVPFPILSVEQNSTITNNGTLSLSGGAGSGTNRGAAMLGNTNGNTLTNAAGATITTTGAFNDGMAANGSGNTLTNKGTITTAGPNAYGMSAAWGQTNTGQLNNVLINTGTVSTSGSNARATSILGGSGTINNSGTLSTTGSSSNAAYLQGNNDQLINSGKIIVTGASSDAVFSNTVGSSFTATIKNLAGGQIISQNGSAIRTLNGNTTIINAGLVQSNAGTAITMGNGNDSLVLQTGSTIIGSADGGAGSNTVTLQGTGTASNAFLNFQTLTKVDTGTWTLAAPLTGGLAVEVAQGRLILGGNNSGFAGTMLVDPAGILQGTSSTLTPAITNNGLVDFVQPTNGTYGGTISGTGAVAKDGAGVLTLTGPNTYSGGTFFNAGTVAVGADSRLGAAAGPLTFNGGTLQFTNSFNLSASRPITLNAPGGTIDTQGFATTIAQGITGAGALSKAGAGALTLTGNNAYAGGTTISAGTLQLGNGGTTGSIIGDVANSSVLAFNRSDTNTFAGAISGTGSVSQIGTGTTILTGDSTYTGGTTISAGTLQLGNGGTTGSIVGDVADNGVLAFNRSDTATFPGIISGSGSLSQIGAGTTILTGDNTYTGGTTISAGTLQLGNGGTTGSIVGNVTDNGMLAFNRSDTVTFPGTISGTGGVSQIGSGMTILNANNTYTGPTNVLGGKLVVGDPSHTSAALSGGGVTTVAGGATLAGFGIVAGPVANNGTIAVGNALSTFADAPTSTFTIGGDVANSGLITLAGATPGNVLSVHGNYSSSNGTLVLNTELNAGGPLSNQFTDRLLINGNASGNTTVQVKPTGSGAFTGTGAPTPSSGISIIQVGGASSPSAFSLPGGYVAGGATSPFQYGLNAYGPGSPFGLADPSQSLVGNPTGHWDFRLQNAFVTPSGPVTPGTPLPPEARLAVAPQVPAYITAPTALFNAHFQDLTELHRRLGEIRDEQALGLPRYGEVFFRAYGGTFNFTSARNFTDFGFDSSQNYAAFQVGGSWIALDDNRGTLRAGLAGSFGQLSFNPIAPDGQSNTLLNTENLYGIATYQARAGWYVDAIISGGGFYGTVNTPTRGQAATLNGTSVAASIEGGYLIPLGWQRLLAEPEVQVVYQHLNFNGLTDVDGLNVNIGSPNQGVTRVGGRLLRPFEMDNGKFVTLYAELNLLQGFADASSINVSGFDFGTGQFGTAMQVRGGATGMLNVHTAVYADVAWQHQVSSGGFRGWLFNGGFRHDF